MHVKSALIPSCSIIRSIIVMPPSFVELRRCLSANRTRIRHVDLSSYSYSVARAYMIRLEGADFESPTMLAALAAEAKMTPHEFRERYEHTIGKTRRWREGVGLIGDAGPMSSGGSAGVRPSVPTATAR